MTCKSCGTEIADNALICYRCGTATQEPVHAPAATTVPRVRPWMPLVLTLVVLAVAGFVLTRAWDGPQIPVVVWVMLATASVSVAAEVPRSSSSYRRPSRRPSGVVGWSVISSRWRRCARGSAPSASPASWTTC